MLNSLQMWIEEKVLGGKIRSVMQQAAASKNPWVKKFYDGLMANKAPIGAAFLAAWVWAAAGCLQVSTTVLGVAVTFDVIDLFHRAGWASFTCPIAREILGVLGFSLVSAGLIPTDWRAKIVQGKVAA